LGLFQEKEMHIANNVVEDLRGQAAMLSRDPFGNRNPTFHALWEADAHIVSAMTALQFDTALASLVEGNFHTEIVLARCKWCGDQKQIEEAAALLADQERIGHLTPELDFRREKLLAAIKDLDWEKRQLKGSIGKHDWCVSKPCEEGYLVLVDDRPIGYRQHPNWARDLAWETIARLQADGDYRLNDRPSGFMPPALAVRDGQETVKQPNGHYSVENYPLFVCNHGFWDIYANAQGSCVAIPNDEVRAKGCFATVCEDTTYVKGAAPGFCESVRPSKPSNDSVIDVALRAYGAHLNDENFIVRNAKATGVRVVIKGKRIRIEMASSELLASGPISVETVERFVERFWFWTKTSPIVNA
jgi:hypothetical protein